MKRLMVETAAVLLTGAVIALLANLLSPRGLSLTRDYFPASKPAPTAGAPGATHNTGSAPPGPLAPGTPADAAAVVEKAAARLKEKGLQPMAHAEVERLFRDPRFEQERVLFVDARDDHHYEAGHIPGAYQFDRYFPERYFPTLLPACQTAEQIVVYCTGGNCEDSEFAAMALRDAGIAADRLAVYVGGITEWNTKGGPMELGARKSGQLQPPRQP
jgi:rhodanese-related sulfurtransferase